MPRLAQFLSHARRLHARRSVWVVGIGTDRSTGDSLGPLVGTALMRHHVPGLKVLGTLEHPVHAANLAAVAEAIRCEPHPPFVVAVDASLGRQEHVGWIAAARGPLRPGLGVQKDLPPIGDVGVSAIVGVGGFLEFLVLQNTRLGLVMAMSEVIASSLAGIFSETYRESV